MIQIFDRFSLSDEEHRQHWCTQMRRIAMTGMFLASLRACVQCGGYALCENARFDIKRAGIFQPSRGVSNVALCLNTKCLHVTAERTPTLIPKEYQWIFGENEVNVVGSDQVFKKTELRLPDPIALQELKEILLSLN